MSEKILTIIVPSYNMEAYLDRCLGSLIVPQELLDSLEVIVVNDGSTDRTSEIAHQYASRYPKTFRVIDKPNGHYGSCVNAGLAISTGEYIRVLDADDHYVPDVFSRYLQTIREFVQNDPPDVIINDSCAVDPEGATLYTTTYDLPRDCALSVSDLGDRDFGINVLAFRSLAVKGWGYRQTEGCAYTDTEWFTLPFMRVRSARYLHLCFACALHGRVGQTMEQRTFARGYGTVADVVLRIAERFARGCDGASSESMSYVARRITRLVQNVYITCAIGCNGYRVNCDVGRFDSELRRTTVKIYGQVDGKVKLRFLPFTIDVVPIIRSRGDADALRFKMIRCAYRAIHLGALIKRKLMGH